MEKIKVCVLGNETSQDTSLWEKACAKKSCEIDWSVVNLCAWDWLVRINNGNFDLFLTKPGGLTQRYKQLYDERLSISRNELGLKIFPSLPEVLIYENKRYLSYWLKVNNIAHPTTWVFYDKNEVLEWLKSTKYPLVTKSNIGASGSGVSIVKDYVAAQRIVWKAFSSKGLKRSWGFKFSGEGVLKRMLHGMKDKRLLKQKLETYAAVRADLQRGFVIFQEYVEHDFEWRVIRMGDSFFAHKKLKKGDKASGSLLKAYDNPPLDLLDFVKNITDQHKFYSQSIDVFASTSGYLVNEMQCFFGQSDPYQMMIEGIAGRYIHANESWHFEAGDYNANESYDLRLETALDLYRRGLLE